MNDIEKRARDLLAQSSGWNVDDMVEHLGSDVCLFTAEEALDAVRAALTPPEGYVLVPVEPTEEMMVAAGKVVFREAGQQWGSATDLAEGFVIDTQRKCHAAMVAARPQVSP